MAKIKNVLGTSKKIFRTAKKIAGLNSNPKGKNYMIPSTKRKAPRNFKRIV